MKWLDRRRAATRELLDQAVREGIRAEAEKIHADNYSLTQQLKSAQETETRTRTELAEVRAKLRDQTEADLVLVSLQLIVKAVHGEPRDRALEDRQRGYQHQLALMQNQSQYSGFGSAVGGALGWFLPH